MRGDVYLADLAVALHALAAEGPAAEAVAALLGMRLVVDAPALAAPVVPVVVGEGAPREAPRVEGPGSPPASHELPPSRVDAGVRLSPLTPTPPPAWQAPAAVASTSVALKGPVPDALLNPRWTRGVLIAALGMLLDDGEIDVSRVAAAVASRTPMRAVPRRPVRTLRRGVEVLVDRELGPFHLDAVDVIGQLGRVVGEGRVEVRSFRQDARRVEDERGDVDWAPRVRGRPVLVVTESRDGPMWRDLARVARRVGCPVVALVPPDGTPWQPPVCVVPWDRGTTVRDARRGR